MLRFVTCPSAEINREALRHPTLSEVRKPVNINYLAKRIMSELDYTRCYLEDSIIRLEI